MGGVSSSTTRSEQTAEAYLSQQFFGSCNVKCDNVMSGVNIDIINSMVSGDINLTQKCSVDASCMVTNSSDATSDVLIKAANSSNAKDAGGLFSGHLFSSDTASAESRQSIKQTILQSTTETCDMASLNEMKDISILAVNSKIGGSISLNQEGSTKGNCQLGNNMSAAASATAMASNKATSGKDKKGQKKGDKAGIGSIMGFIVVMAVIFIIAKMFTGEEKKNAASAAMMAAADARGLAGCPGGVKPIMNPKTGKAVIDPRTMGPICPPQSFSPPPPPVVNVNLGDAIRAQRPR